MYRALQVNTAKNIEIVTAGAELTRGMAVVYNPATKTVDKTGTGEICLLDVAPNYDGINAAVTPNDSEFETVKEGDLVLKITLYPGEHYATNQITVSGLAAGDALKMENGLLVKADSDAEGTFKYIGAYADPTFANMHEVYVL